MFTASLAMMALVGWLLIAGDRSRAWPRGLLLGVPQRRPTALCPKAVAVIVPARNEASMLPMTLPSLLRQEVPGLEIFVVDDGSVDGTAEVARGIAARSGSGVPVHVLEAGLRPPGWAGKVHAMQRGFRGVMEESARQQVEPPEWILFTDADIEHREDSVSDLLRQAGEPGSVQVFDLVSVMARLRAETFWERVVVPPFVFFFQLLYPFRQVARVRSPVAAAAGGCLLIRRQTLHEAGGLEAIRDAVIDDVALARAARAVGARLWLGFDPQIVSRRTYPELRDLWHMVSRTAFSQLRYSPFLLLLTSCALLVFVISPPLLIGFEWFEHLWTERPWNVADRLTLLAALLAWGLMSWCLYPAVRHQRVPAAYSLSLPLSGTLFAGMTLTSAWNHWRGGTPSWRERPD